MIVGAVFCVSVSGGTACAQSIGATYDDSPKVSTRLEGDYKIESGKIVDRYAIGPRLRDIQKLEEGKEERLAVPYKKTKPAFFYEEDRSERDMQLKSKRKKAN